MKLNQACVLAMTSLLPFSTLWLHAADSTVTTTTTTVESTSAAQSAQMESVKRQQLIFSASQAISDGQRLLHSGKYDEAADRFQYALDALTNGGVSEALYERAEAGLATAREEFQAGLGSVPPAPPPPSEGESSNEEKDAEAGETEAHEDTEAAADPVEPAA